MHTTLTELDEQSIIAKLTAFRCKFHRNKGTPFTHSLNSFLDRSREATNLDTDRQDGGKDSFVLVGGA